MHAMSRRVFFVLAIGLASACAGGGPAARDPGAAITLALVNGVVWTGDAGRPSAEAVAMAGDRIVHVGTTAEVQAMAGAARVVDARGGFVVPGFVDAHVHFVEGGFRLASVQLRDAATREEFVRRLAAFAAGAPKGTWITGGDWDHERWGGELPAREWIDAVTPDHPVWVNRLDGHMALANTAALRAAGIDERTAEVAGGEIVRAGAGRPTGVLKDNAMALVDRVVPAPSPAMLDRAIDAAMSYVAAQGVTSVHHMGSWADVEALGRTHEAGRLRTRVYAAVPLSDWARLRDRVASAGRGDAWLRIGLLKGFVDGSLGSKTALFDEPYAGSRTERGLAVTPMTDLRAWIAGADRAGLQVAVHAIGDRANRELLDAYAETARAHGPRDRRFRIEHAQHLSPADIPRFASLGVIPSMQPYHAIDDGRWAERVIGGPRLQTTYAFRSLLDADARLAFGSDWFVAPPTPLEGIYAAVTRRTLDDANPGGWVPAQRIRVEEALRAYTAGGAWAGFREGDTGVLAPGRLADVVVIDRDLRAVPPETIRQARIVTTVVGGRIVFEGPRQP
jgi:predicted amidohydrolase YtcJ